MAGFVSNVRIFSFSFSIWLIRICGDLIYRCGKNLLVVAGQHLLDFLFRGIGFHYLAQRRKGDLTQVRTCEQKLHISTPTVCHTNLVLSLHATLVLLAGFAFRVLVAAKGGQELFLEGGSLRPAEINVGRVGPAKIGQLNVLDSLFDPIGKLRSICSDALELAGKMRSLLLGCNTVDGLVVQLLDLVNVLIDLGNLLLDGSDLGEEAVRVVQGGNIAHRNHYRRREVLLLLWRCVLCLLDKALWSILLLSSVQLSVLLNVLLLSVVLLSVLLLSVLLVVRLLLLLLLLTRQVHGGA